MSVAFITLMELNWQTEITPPGETNKVAADITLRQIMCCFIMIKGQSTYHSVAAEQRTKQMKNPTRDKKNAHCLKSFAYKENNEKTAAHRHETKCDEFDHNTNTSFIIKLR